MKAETAGKVHNMGNGKLKRKIKRKLRIAVKRGGMFLLCVFVIANTIQMNALAAAETAAAVSEGNVQDSMDISENVTDGSLDESGTQIEPPPKITDDETPGEGVDDSRYEDQGESDADSSDTNDTGDSDSDSSDADDFGDSDVDSSDTDDSGDSDSDSSDTDDSGDSDSDSSDTDDSGDSDSDSSDADDSGDSDADSSDADDSGDSDADSSDADDSGNSDVDSPDEDESGDSDTDSSDADDSGDSDADSSDADDSGDSDTDSSDADDSGDSNTDSSDADESEDSDADDPNSEEPEDQEGSTGEPDEDAEEVPEEESGDLELYADSQTEETLQLSVTYPSELNAGKLTLTDGPMVFAISPGISGSTVNEPVLKIKIPSCMEVTRYHDDNVDGLIAPGSTITLEKIGEYTVVTYRFKGNIAYIGFGMEAKIPSGYKVKDGQTYSITAEYYNGSKLLKSETNDFTTLNPTVQENFLYLTDSWNSTIYLESDQSVYYTEPFFRTVHSSYFNHYPYDSVTLTAPLPEEAVPCTRSGSGYTAMSSGTAITVNSVYGTYTVTNNNGNLVYKLTSGSFLSSGSSFTFSGGIYLRFESPSDDKYESASADKIEYVVNGKSAAASGATSYKTSVEFKNYPDVTVDPDTEWTDTITLQPDETVYYTREYSRCIRLRDSNHPKFDSVKMTVPLPEGAEPGFGTGSSFTPLKNEETKTVNDYYNGTWTVTYYSNKDTNMLEYELQSGSFLTSGSWFKFSGSYSSDKLYLRITNPIAGAEYKSSSPTIECKANGNTIASYTPASSDYTYATTVTIYQPPMESGLYSDFDAEPKDTGWSDTIILENGQTVYDTKMYNRAIYSTEAVHYYPYESVKMIVFLPDRAVPGIGSGTAFSPLISGQRREMSSTWAVTYHEAYSYGSGTAKALVYEILPGTPFLTSGLGFSFTTGTPSQNLYLRFTDQESAGVYTSVRSPRVEYILNGVQYVNDSKETQSDTSVTFKERSVQWTGLSVSCDTNTTPYVGYNSYVLPEEYQNDKVYEGYILNRTGFTLQDIQVAYTFDEGLNADKLLFYFGESGYPAGAEISYTTRQNTEETTVKLNTGNNVLSLEQGDAFLTAVVTYDSLENADTKKKVMSASVHNYDRLQETTTRRINAVVQSAECDRDNHESEKEFGSRAYYSFNLISKLNTLTATVKTAPLALEKGKAFTVTVTTGTISGIGKFQNLSLYLRMPRGYILTGYEPPAGTKKTAYVTGSRTLEDGDILYRIEYTDNVLYNSGRHIFGFKVGPEADAFELAEINMPTAVYAATGEGTLFQFYSPKTESEIGLDINGDSDEEDLFFVPGVDTVKIWPFVLMSAEGYLSTEDQVGEDTSYKYHHGSGGNYRFYLYNGLKSGGIVTAGEVIVTLPRTGKEFTYNEEKYISQWDVLLTGPAEPGGSFWEGAEILYSSEWEGENWQTADQVMTSGGYRDIVRIKVTAAPEKKLAKAESASLNIPFEADFLSGGMKDDGTEYKTYISAYMTYDLDTAPDPVMIDLLNELKTAPTEFSGTVFNDKNGNWIQDEDEDDGNSYSLSLYSSEGTKGNLIKKINTNEDGSYSFSVLLPGTYTLHVEKGNEELYEYLSKGCVFNENGNYVFQLSPKATPITENINLGIVTPRTMSVDSDLLTLVEGKPQTLGYTLNPALFDWERGKGKTVTFKSLDSSVATVNQDGILCFAGEGSTTVTVTAPQLEAVARLWQEETGTTESFAWLTEEVQVTTQWDGCHVTAEPFLRTTTEEGSEISENPELELELEIGGSIEQPLYYYYAENGYCNKVDHALDRAVTAEIVDDGGTSAVIFPMDSAQTANDADISLFADNIGEEYQGYTLAVSLPGTIKIKFSASPWNHDPDNCPADLILTVTVKPMELPPPVFSVYPEMPDGDNGWYVTEPQVTLLSGTTASCVNTWFQKNEDIYRELTEDNRPLTEKSGLYSFSAYNFAYSETTPVWSETTVLETLKVDLDAPIILVDKTTFSPVGVNILSGIGRFLTFGNFFKESIRVNIQAEDAESGVSTLYYILPEQDVKSAKIEEDGSCYFDIPLDTSGCIVYYVTDKAGNLSDEIILRKDKGPDLWVIEDRAPVWSPFEMTDMAGEPGARGADGNTWFRGTVNITGEVTDEDSGLAMVSANINGGDPEYVWFDRLPPAARIADTETATTEDGSTEDGRQFSYVLKKTLDFEGKNVLRAEAEDNAKNVSVAETIIGIDRTAPDIVLEKTYLANGVPYALVLVTDEGSGIHPETIQITWRGQTIPGEITVTTGGYEVLFPLQSVAPGNTEEPLRVVAKDYVGWEAELLVECFVQAADNPKEPEPEPKPEPEPEPPNRGVLDQVPKTGEIPSSGTEMVLSHGAEAFMMTRKRDEQDEEDERLWQT